MTLIELISSMGTQVEAGRRIGVAQGTISNWLRGESVPRSQLQVRAIAQAANLSVEDVQALVDRARATRHPGIPIDTPAQTRQVLAERGHPVPQEA